MVGKLILEFCLLDADSVIDEDGTAARLFGITKEGKRVVAYDYSIKPHFCIVFNQKKTEPALEYLRKQNLESNKISGMEVLKRNLVGNPVTAIKIKTEKPMNMASIKQLAKDMPGYIDIAETDIHFSKMYFVEKKITSLGRIRVSGREIEKKHNADYVIVADSVEEVDLEVPELNILALDIETYSPAGTPRMNSDPIIMISMASSDGFKRVITWKGIKDAPDFAEIVNSERSLLERTDSILKHLKPDVIVGYNSDNFDFPFILARAKKHDIEFEWGLDRSILKTFRKGIGVVSRVTGIPHLDLYIFIRNTLAPSLHTETYDLDSVARELVGTGKTEGVSWEKLNEMWESGNIRKLIDYSMNDSLITLKVAEKIIPLVFEISKLVGQTIFDVSRMTYGRYVEWYLIKNAHRLNELIPSKPGGGFVSSRLSRTYEGAYVLDPKPGVFDNIIVYDFRSLYPSVMVSHNICPTTIFCDCCREGHKTPSIGGKTYTFCKDEKGFIPGLIEDLINRRARIKELLRGIKKDDKDYGILSARSYALKTVANAVYGYLGFAKSRWYCIECAASITAWSRHYIKGVIEKATENGFEVLYSDTDSLFIALSRKNIQDAEDFVKDVNKELPETMELELQGFYPRGIFVSAKKRYALLDKNGEIVVKGFEFVRRDWSRIAKETQMKVLRAILIDNSKEKALEIIKNTVNELKSGKVPLDKVVINTQLTRRIKDYESIGPHVSAAKKAEESGRYSFEPGQMIKYVVSKGKGSISDKAYLLEEFERKELEYDADYYINNQVLPPVDKLFEVFGYSKDEIKGKFQTTLGGFLK